MKAHGVKQVPLHQATGISQAALSYYCNGRPPTAEHLCRLADYFGVTMDELWGRMPLELSEVESISKPELRKWNPPISMADSQLAPQNSFEETSKRAKTKALSKP